MSCTDAARSALASWLRSGDAAAAADAIEAAGVARADALGWLHAVTDDPGSAARIVDLVRAARGRAGIATGSVALERWLLVQQGMRALDALDRGDLGDGARSLTAAEIASLAQDDASMQKALAAPGPRFREFARIVTGRRWSAGVFHWEDGGIRRSWLTKVPPRDLIGLARALARMGGFDRMMFMHLNGRRASPHLDELSLNRCYAVLAETLARRRDLRGVAAASWIRSPDTHRVSPRLAAVNAPVRAGGGFVTTVGRAPLDCGVFARSDTRRAAYDEGSFVPTIGLVLWPREDLLRWWRAHPELAQASAA